MTNGFCDGDTMTTDVVKIQDVLLFYEGLDP